MDAIKLLLYYIFSFPLLLISVLKLYSKEPFPCGTKNIQQTYYFNHNLIIFPVAYSFKSLFPALLQDCAAILEEIMFSLIQNDLGLNILGGYFLVHMELIYF